VWNVEKIISKGDYNYAVVRGHPAATAVGDYVLHHRVVMENHLNRLLQHDEVVHHVNGDKKDNRVENLKVMGNSEHARLHQVGAPKKMVDLKCPQCDKIFTRARGQSFLGGKGTEYTTCSPRCRGKLSRYIQLHGRTPKVKRAISENLVREFIVKFSPDNPEETV
jgi:phage FluMu protein Com